MRVNLMSKCTMSRICEYCKEEYDPNPYHNGGQSKYCSTSCKDKTAYYKAKEAGHIKAFKSGYPRAMSIRLYMQARNADISCPCHYCQARVYPDTFQLDHKTALPTDKVMTKEEWRILYRDESNLVVCCSSCNRLKAGIPYETFKERKKNAIAI